MARPVFFNRISFQQTNFALISMMTGTKTLDMMRMIDTKQRFDYRLQEMDKRMAGIKTMT